MMLKELGEEYKESSRACKMRADRLRPLLHSPDICEMERLRLRRRIYILDSMARDAMATAKYLINYYGDDENGENMQRRGISGFEELPEAGIGKELGSGARALCRAGGAYSTSAANGANVLPSANAHAIHRP